MHKTPLAVFKKERQASAEHSMIPDGEQELTMNVDSAAARYLLLPRHSCRGIDRRGIKALAKLMIG